MRRQRFVWYFIIFCFILFNLSTYVGSQDVTKPKIVISVDLEGVAHVVGNASGPGSYYYDEARELVTKEINAAIEGCLEAGAGEIVVADNHGNSLTIIPEKLHEAAKLARGWPRPLDLSTGIDENTAGVIFLGFHAKEGTPRANFPHTLLGKFDVIINGIYVSETLFSAALAGEFNVPVILITGDQHVIQEAKKYLGHIETVLTKESFASYSAQSPHPKVIRQQIKEKSKRAVQRLKEFKPFRFEPPIKMEFIYQKAFDAEALSYFPWFKREGGKTVSVELKNMKEACNIINGLAALSMTDK